MARSARSRAARDMPLSSALAPRLAALLGTAALAGGLAAVAIVPAEPDEPGRRLTPAWSRTDAESPRPTVADDDDRADAAAEDARAVSSYAVVPPPAPEVPPAAAPVDAPPARTDVAAGPAGGTGTGAPRTPPTTRGRPAAAPTTTTHPEPEPAPATPPTTTATDDGCADPKPQHDCRHDDERGRGHTSGHPTPPSR